MGAGSVGSLAVLLTLRDLDGHLLCGLLDGREELHRKPVLQPVQPRAHRTSYLAALLRVLPTRQSFVLAPGVDVV